MSRVGILSVTVEERVKNGFDGGCVELRKNRWEFRRGRSELMSMEVGAIKVGQRDMTRGRT